MCTDTYCRSAGDFKIYIKEIVIIIFLLKHKLVHFVNSTLQNALFLYFSSKKFGGFKKKLYLCTVKQKTRIKTKTKLL